MLVDAKILWKSFSPRILTKALTSLDRSTAVIISAFWLAALVILILAVFAVHGAVSARQEAALALVAEPVLPVTTNTDMTLREAQGVLDRLQHQFPGIKIELGSNHVLVIKTDDGSKFHQWIAALSYVDTMAPEFHWVFQDFCVGNCKNHGLMSASVTGARVTFALPQQ